MLYTDIRTPSVVARIGVHVHSVYPRLGWPPAVASDKSIPCTTLHVALLPGTKARLTPITHPNDRKSSRVGF